MITPITQQEINRNKVASLPARPNASVAFGGAGYTSAELKAAFDRLPLLLAERYNALVEAIGDGGEEGISANIPTGIANPNGDIYSLHELLGHIQDGTFATYLKVGASYLDLVLATLAPLESPAFLGSPTAITPASSEDSGRIATTAWVKQVYQEMFSLFEDVRQGNYGNLPRGGEANDVLLKTSATDHETAWTPLKSYEFENPTANTQSQEDNSTKVATTAFVQTLLRREIDKLKGGAEEAYDTLLELAEAIKANDNDIADALNTIAEKDNKTVFRTFKNEATVSLQSATEYRAEEPISALTLNFPRNPTDDFITSLLFSTNASNDMNCTYTDNIYMTGDDCTDGDFLPFRGAHYTVVIWYGGGKFQGVVRRSE